jgi:hypothetical protein
VKHQPATGALVLGDELDRPARDPRPLVLAEHALESRRQ